MKFCRKEKKIYRKHSLNERHKRKRDSRRHQNSTIKDVLLESNVLSTMYV